MEGLDKQIESIQTNLTSKLDNLETQYQGLKNEGATKAELLKVESAIKKQGETLEEFLTESKEAKGKFFHEQLGSFMNANKEKIQEIKAAGHGLVEFHPDREAIDKAAADMMRTNGTIGTVPAYNDVVLPNVALRNDNPMLNYARKYNTNKASQPYSEIIETNGDAEAVAEGGKKPQIDFKWNTNYATPYKVAAYEVLTEEVVQDIPRMMSVAKDFLKQKHDLKKVDLVYFGNGTAPNPKGATAYGTAMTTGGALSKKVPNPNFADMLNAAIYELYTRPIATGTKIPDAMPFTPNIVMVNPADFMLNYVAAKDSRGLPLYPTAGIFQKVKIGPVTVVPWIKIPAGKVFVADMKKYNLSNYIPYFIKIGWINDQLIHNMFTIVGESRFHAYVKAQDEKAFLYDDITAIFTEITAATP